MHEIIQMTYSLNQMQEFLSVIKSGLEPIPLLLKELVSQTT